MKKRLILPMVMLLALLCLAPAASAAQTQGKAGNYYYTDIKTYLFGEEINTINIGGETLIDAESLAHYGFTVRWHPKARWLEICDNGIHILDGKAKSGELLDMRAGETGKVAGKYYYTDIETTIASVKGTWITQSYNIGGRTFIGAEQLRGFGFIVYWNPEARTLTIEPGYKSSSISPVWSMPILSGDAWTGDSGTADSFWFAAEKDIDTGKFSYVSGKGSESLSAATLMRDLWGRLALSLCLYDGSPVQLSGALYGQLEEASTLRYLSPAKDSAVVSGALSDLIQVYLNGAPVSITAMDYSRSSTRTVFTLFLDGDGLEPDDVYSLALLCSVPAEAEITLPPDTSQMTPYEVSRMRLLDNVSAAGGSVVWEKETESRGIICCGVPTPHGRTYALTLLRREDGTTVSLSGQTGLSDIWGVHPEICDLSLSADEATLYFASDREGETHHFSVKLETGRVKQIKK